MGANYSYYNLTKRERFSCDALGGNSRRPGCGRDLTSRAFHLLLIDTTRFPKTIGVELEQWSGDSICLLTDTDVDWTRYEQEFADISADLILLVLRRDGYETIGEAAEVDDHLFMQICHLAVTKQAPELEPHLKEQFGTNWRQRYKDKCANGYFKPLDLLRTQRLCCPSSE